MFVLPLCLALGISRPTLTDATTLAHAAAAGGETDAAPLLDESDAWLTAALDAYYRTGKVSEVLIDLGMIPR